METRPAPIEFMSRPSMERPIVERPSGISISGGASGISVSGGTSGYSVSGGASGYSSAMSSASFSGSGVESSMTRPAPLEFVSRPSIGRPSIGRPSMGRPYAFSVSGGAGGYGTKISTASYSSGGYDYHSLAASSSTAMAIGNEKATMQHLNDRLATYLEMVRKLEKANGALEIKIRKTIEKKGTIEGKDYGKYFVIIEELRVKIFEMVKGNAYLAIALDNARLASDDFRFKMEYELSLRQTVEADIMRLRKLLDETNVFRLHLESTIESLKEELINIKKIHATDVAELHVQISQYGVHVDVDAHKGPDLAKIIEEMREKYERIVLKNQKELKLWHEAQITEVQVQVTQSTTALKEASVLLTETRRRYQSLEIELQSVLSLKMSLEATLLEVEARFNMQMEKYNIIILKLQEELTQIRIDIQQNTREYEILLNIKVKLEAEIAEYRRLLEVGVKLPVKGDSSSSSSSSSEDESK